MTMCKYSSKMDLKKVMHDYNSMDDTMKNAAIMNPGHVDESKWKEAKEAVHKEYGDYKWPVVMHVYEKMMGK